MFSSDYLKEKAHAKVNLTFKLLGKLNTNYHSVDSIVTFLPTFMIIFSVQKNKKLIIKTYWGIFKNLIKEGIPWYQNRFKPSKKNYNL